MQTPDSHTPILSSTVRRRSKDMCQSKTTGGVTGGHRVIPLSPTSALHNTGSPSPQSARRNAKVSLCYVTISAGSHAVNDWLAWPLLTQRQFLHWLGGELGPDVISPKIEANRGSGGC